MRRARARLVIAGASALLLAGGLTGCGAPRWRSELVSVNASGTDAGNSSSDTFAVSPDGTKVAFESTATDLVPGVTQLGVLYMRDLTTGTTTVLAAAPDGTPANAQVRKPVFSPDGSKVAFATLATNLGPTDTSDTMDIYVRDLATGFNTLATPNAAGTGGGGGQFDFISTSAVFSPDGSKVAFVSANGTFGPTDTNGTGDVYVRDLTAGATTLVSRNAAGTDSANRQSVGPVFSPDSTKVAFESDATNLGPVDTDPAGPAARDVYLYDLATDAMALVSANAAGTDSGNYRSITPTFSPDGTTLAFASAANDLGPVDTNSCIVGGPAGFCEDVYTRNLATGETGLISTNAAGTDSGNSASYAPVYSPDGTSLAFSSGASNLGPVDADTTCTTPPRNCHDIYVKHLGTAATTLVSTGPDGAASHGESSKPIFSQDGSQIVFTSMAKDLGPNDPNNFPDIYMRNLAGGTTTLVSINAAGTESVGAGSSGNAALTPSDRVVFATLGGALGPNDTNELPDVYIASLS